jgi:GNAT superfamily N-acetyltransferase
MQNVRWPYTEVAPAADQAGPQSEHNFAVSDQAPLGTFEAIRSALNASAEPLIGPAFAHRLIIPLQDDAGRPSGGLWGCTIFQWLHVQMLFVPQSCRGQGVGTALMIAAESEAMARGCRGAAVDTYSFQAGGFYRRLGYTLCGELKGYPCGYSLLHFSKWFAAPPQ